MDSSLLAGCRSVRRKISQGPHERFALRPNSGAVLVAHCAWLVQCIIKLVLVCIASWPIAVFTVALRPNQYAYAPLPDPQIQRMNTRHQNSVLRQVSKTSCDQQILIDKSMVLRRFELQSFRIYLTEVLKRQSKCLCRNQ